MMLGSKAFDPSNTELLCTACSRNSQKHSQLYLLFVLMSVELLYVLNYIVSFRCVVHINNL